MTKLDEKRNAHKFQAIVTLEQSNKLSKINFLREKTNSPYPIDEISMVIVTLLMCFSHSLTYTVTKETLEKMYDQYKAFLLEKECFTLNCEKFEILFFQYFPNWKSVCPQLHLLIWKV